MRNNFASTSFFFFMEAALGNRPQTSPPFLKVDQYKRFFIPAFFLCFLLAAGTLSAAPYPTDNDEDYKPYRGRYQPPAGNIPPTHYDDDAMPSPQPSREMPSRPRYAPQDNDTDYIPPRPLNPEEHQPAGQRPPPSDNDSDYVPPRNLAPSGGEENMDFYPLYY